MARVATDSPPLPALRRPEVRAAIVTSIRALVAAGLLTAAYFLLPLNRLSGVADWAKFTLGLGLLGVVVGLQLRAVLRSTTPEARAVQALAVTIPLFLYLFAATYYVLAVSDPTKFSQQELTRLDALYFTITVFATVGFGDITPTAESSRLIVTVQMVLDLVLLGVVIRVFLTAVDRARRRTQPQTPPTAETGTGA